MIRQGHDSIPKLMTAPQQRCPVRQEEDDEERVRRENDRLATEDAFCIGDGALEAAVTQGKMQ